MFLLGCARKLSVPLQKLVRGWLARSRLKALITKHRIESHYAIFVQKQFRGNYVRTRDKLVWPAVLALRTARLHAKRSAAAVTLQCLIRRVLAASRRRMLFTDLTMRIRLSIRVQSIARRMFGRKRKLKLQMWAELQFYYRTKMITRIQCFYRQCLARKALRQQMSLTLSRLVIQHHAARTLQSFFRGMTGRRIARRERLMLKQRHAAATNIQRIFRGSQILHWRQLKWNALSCHIQLRAHMELDKAMRMRKALTKASLGNETDKCPEYEIASLESNADHIEILTHAFGESYVGLKCKIYWPDGMYRGGWISDYDKRIRLWQLAYKDDDVEWLNLVRDQDRVLINNGHSWIPFSHFRTRQLAAYLMQRDALQLSRKDKLNSSPLNDEQRDSADSFAPIRPVNGQCLDGAAAGCSQPDDINASREKVYSDLWLSSYVARGLLDEFYKSKSKESIEKLRNAHTVKALAVSIGAMKQLLGSEDICVHVNLLHFSQLLKEVESVLESARTIESWQKL